MSERAIATTTAVFKRFGSKLRVARLLILIVLVFPHGVGAQDRIFIGYDGHAGFQGVIWAAKDLRLFEKYGFAAELVLIPGSARGMAALLSESADFVQGSATAPLSAYLRGGDVAVVAAALNKFPFSVVTRKDIRTPSQLVRKKIGIVNFGGSNDLAVTLALKEWNIPRNAVTILASGGAPERLAALLSGVLDATVLSPPETVAASQAGLNILANLSELSASFPQTLIMVRRSFLARNRDTVKRFVRAYSEAIRDFKSDKESAIRVYAKHLKQSDRKILEETYNYYAPRFSFPPRVDRDGVNNALELVRQSAKEKGDVNLGPFIDESVLDELEQEGFFKKLGDARRTK
jgi:ABC-type nitrate/sulfonate/bicarbonate transport system substrate-binding protein